MEFRLRARRQLLNQFTLAGVLYCILAVVATTAIFVNDGTPGRKIWYVWLGGIFGILFGSMAIAALVSLLQAVLYEVTLADDRLQVQTLRGKRSYSSADIKSLAWSESPASDEGVVSISMNNGRRETIITSMFTDEDRLQLIRKLRYLIPDDRQVGWTEDWLTCGSRTALNTVERFRGWIHFSVVLNTAIVLGQAIGKIPERSPEFHWFFGRVSPWNFIMTRVIMIAALSVSFSAFVAWMGVDPPWIKAGRWGTRRNRG